MVARSERRRLRGSVLLLAAMVALVSGTVFAAAAGARRTSSVLDRFVETTSMPDAMVGLARPRVASDPELLNGVATQLAELDGVEEVLIVHGIPAVGQTEEDMTLLTTSVDGAVPARSPLLLSGRLPFDDSLSEVALNEGAADELGLAVGDSFSTASTTVRTAEALFDGQLDEFVTDGPELSFEVVGTYRDSGSFDVTVPPVGLVSPAVTALLGEVAAFSAFFELSGDVERIDLEAAFAIVQPAAAEGELFGGYLEDQVDPVRTAFNAIAAGLALFALVAAGAGLIAVGLAVSRQLALSDSVVNEARSLGMSRSALTVAIALPAAMAGLGGVLFGLLLSVLASPLFPISTARLAEVDPGFRIDTGVLVVGGAVAALAVVAWTLAAAWRQTKVRHVAVQGGRSGWASLRRLLPPTVAMGFSSVVDRRARSGLRVGSAVLGAVVGIAGIFGIFVFTVSQHEASADASRFGWAGDTRPDVFVEDPQPMVEALAADPRLAAVGGVFCDPMEVQGQLETGCSLLVVSGTLELTYLDGRVPLSPSEVAVGLETMTRSGVGIGDEIEVRGASGIVASLTIVGTVASPNVSDDPGRGVVLTLDTFEELADEFYDQDLVLTYSEGLDRAEIEAALVAEHPLEFNVYSYPSPPPSLSQLSRIRPTLIALAVFMGVLGVVGLMHFQLLSTRRRRGDIAVLKALGFVRRQVRAVVAWQATTIALIGVAAGVPLGLIIGRWAWIAAVDQIGIVDTPTIPWALVVATGAAALIGAAALSMVPGRLAARRNASEVLRAE